MVEHDMSLVRERYLRSPFQGQHEGTWNARELTVPSIRELTVGLHVAFLQVVGALQPRKEFAWMT